MGFAVLEGTVGDLSKEGALVSRPEGPVTAVCAEDVSGLHHDASHDRETPLVDSRGVRDDCGAPDAEGECAGDACITCGDEGRPGVVVDRPTGAFAPVVVRSERGLEEVDVTLVGDVSVGDTVLIHAGTAIVRVSADTGADGKARP
ncbi:MAG: HypC/HybG/HupF family hydrogenase formation chaperone [Bifidobacteriaceae bacterium]|nr:HypC/HybG/HupF family hydrogenase formation chaperone [Bifidobacteriaceae bacterium]